MSKKKISAYLILIFNFSILLGQNTEYFVNTKINYDMYLNFKNIEKFKATLFFNDSITIFKYKNKTKNSEKESSSFKGVNMEVNIVDTTTFSDVFYKRKNILLSKDRNVKNKKYHYVKERIPILKWRLTSNKKTISSIECYEATCSFRGRDYVAWYAPSIPTQNGPWKLHGLPGLIIEAYDVYKEVYFIAKDIELHHNSKEQIMSPINRIIDIKEHLKNQNEELDEVTRKMAALLGRGIEIDVEVKSTGIELNFDDILDE